MPKSERTSEVAVAVEKAKRVIDQVSKARFAEFREVHKTIWGSPAGKKKLAVRLAAMLPAHMTYVEPFAGSAAVLFAKEPVPVEVLCDADIEIARAYRTIKRLTREQISKLRARNWKGDEATFKRLVDTQPTSDVDSLYRFLYLSHFSYGKLRGKSFSPSGAGVESRTVERVEAFAPRLKNVRVYDGDYLKVVRKYDSPSTVFFLDPPYAGHNVDVGESKFDEERFFEVLKSLKGKFLLTYGIRGKLPGLLRASKFNVQQIRTRRSIRSMRGVGGPTMLTQLVVTNYKPLAKSQLSDNEWVVEDWTEIAEPVEKVQPFGTFGGSHHYAKRIVPLIPEHKTYVEPFAGAAAVLHAKEPSEQEVLADLDADLVFMHKFIKGLTAKKVDKLKGFDWTCTETSWKRVRDMTPGNDLERFYKLAFIRGKGRDARPDATHPAGAAMGQTTNPEKYLRASERLKNVSILRQDYHKTISAHDGPDTFFFIDPPYPGEWFDKNAVIDLDEFISTLKGIKGKFIAVLNDSKENVAAFKQVGQIFRLKVREASGTGGVKQASRLFCANYRVRKCDDIEEIDLQEELDKAVWSRAYINDLPDESFLYIEPGGEKDEDGKTVPRQLRHFPVRDVDGKLDLPHVRNAIARIPQSKIPGLSDDDLEKLQEKARELLAEALKEDEQDESETSSRFSKSIPLIKGLDKQDERFVLGIVLEPEVVDAQGDIYSAEEIRVAAHRFLEEFGGLGVMHRFRANGDVKILESYLAPLDFEIGGKAVRKGTWLLAVRVLSDELWEQVKAGELSGFSIGGSARRVSEDSDKEPTAGELTKQADEVEKGAAQASGLKPRDAINRLLDILVEEVSLVDRAANKHRFLIVKRSDHMDTNQTTADPTQESENESTEATPASTEESAAAEDTSQVSIDDAPLGIAVEVLEGMTNAVEALASLNDDEARARITGLSSELRALSEQLVSAGNPAADPDGDGAAESSREDVPVDTKSTATGELLAAVRDSLQRIGDLFEASREKGNRPDKASDGSPGAGKPTEQAPVTKEEGELTRAVRSLVDAVKSQQQRLARLEKRFGLPNSLEAGEVVPRPGKEAVSWPLDLNKPVDQQSVDRSVSFHDV